MDSQSEGWSSFCDIDGGVGSGHVCHDGGTGKNAAGMCFFNGLVDALGKPEIIGIDDYFPHHGGEFKGTLGYSQSIFASGFVAAALRHLNSKYNLSGLLRPKSALGPRYWRMLSRGGSRE